MIKLLIGSPIRQKPNILKEFLLGLQEASKEGLSVSYYFVDDNTELESSRLLSDFSELNDTILIKGYEIVSDLVDNDYICDNDHHWRSENISRITVFKDTIIEYAIEKEYDYLFLVDSDIVLFKDTLQLLISRKVEIVSNVFWTQWQVNKSLSPQCFWIPDLYQQNTAFNQRMSPEEANRIRGEMIDRLRIPGIYQVDGLGACTMIACSALQKGVRFKTIPNLSVPGEDRHFCIRAGALGIDLFMDTVQPVYHIYRDEYLDRVEEFKRDGFKFDMCQTFDNTEPVSIQQKRPFHKRIPKKFNRMLKWKKSL